MRRFGYLALLGMAALAPSVVFADPPPRLDKPGKKVRFISLAEARAIALEQVGQPSLLFPGVGLDNRVTVPSGHESNSSHVRVLCKPGSKSLILTGTSADHHRTELERNINQMLLNVETAYWNLYGSYWQLYSREEGLRLAYETWKIAEEKHKDGKAGQAQVAAAEAQYYLFASQRLSAVDTVLDNERQLRAMLGLKIKDGTRLVPSDAPTLVEKKPDWERGLHTMMKKRPELAMARQDVKLAGWEVAMTEALGEYVPSEGVRGAKLQLARASLVLHDQEEKAERYLALWQRRMSSSYLQIKAARAQCDAFATQLGIRNKLYRTGANEAGSGDPVTLNLLLEAQRSWADALGTECQAIVTYNNALVGWEYAKGDVIKHAHVRLMDEAPEDSDMVRAVDREHKRTRQRVRQVPGVLAMDTKRCPIWVLGEGESPKSVPSLPALWKFYPPLKQVGEVQKGLVEGQVVD